MECGQTEDGSHEESFTKKLLRDEVTILSKRVDALMILADKIEEQQIKDWNFGACDKKKSDEFEIVEHLPLSTTTCNNNNAWEIMSDDDDISKNKSTNSEVVEGNGQLDLFGASTTFSSVEEQAKETVESENKISLLDWN